MIKQNVAGMLSLVDEKYVSEADPTQSKPKQKLGWQKLTAIAASICVFISVLAISILIPTMGSDKPPVNNYPALEWGFEYSAHEPIPDAFCAYQSGINEFDLNNVVVNFCYGGLFSPDINHELENGRNIPEFDVYFGDSYYKPLYLVRHSTENFVSEKYRCTVGSSEGVVLIGYSYSERIIIPQELFVKQQGVISFCIGGVNVNEYDPEYDPELVPEYKVIACILMNYDIKDGKVVLSKWDGKRM